MQDSSIYAPFIFSPVDHNQRNLSSSSSYAPAYPSYTPSNSFTPQSSPPQSFYSDNVPRMPCRWGGHCPILLDDVSAAGIMRHLKEYHLSTPSNPWNKKSRGICQWDSHCGKEMAYASYGKHVAAVHLRTGVQCPNCNKDVGRPGLLERHMRDYCQQA